MTRRSPISEGISYPPEAELYKDTGFQGYEPAVNEDLPGEKKSRPEGNSQPAEKRTNRKLARIRVNVEHALAGVKRCRIVKDVLRNTKDGDLGFGHGSGLWITQPSCAEPQAATETVAKSLISDRV